MRKITLELPDSDMAALEAEARGRHIAPTLLAADKLRAEVNRIERMVAAVSSPATMNDDVVRAELMEEMGDSQKAPASTADPTALLLRMRRELVALSVSTMADALRPALPGAVSGIDALLAALATPESHPDLEGRRRARLAILESSRGCWDGEPGKPKDGVFYQQELRAEWP